MLLGKALTIAKMLLVLAGTPERDMRLEVACWTVPATGEAGCTTRDDEVIVTLDGRVTIDAIAPAWEE